MRANRLQCSVRDDFYHYYHYSVWNRLLVYLFSNPLLRNKGGSDQILSDTTTIHWNNECCIKRQQVWKWSFFPHKFNMLPEAATKHKVANQNEDFTHTYIYIYIYLGTFKSWSKFLPLFCVLSALLAYFLSLCISCHGLHRCW